MTFTEGQTVRFNVKGEAEYGQIGTVIGETTNPVDGVTSVWVKMPFGHAWLYRKHELIAVDVVDEEHLVYTIAVGGGFAVGVVYSSRERAESEAKRLKLKYYEVIPHRITKNA